ncbi:MAG: methionine adenosyltransferase [bacterium]|nr:MAG: methionine adenosyltransferase [bacterium]
MNNFSFSSESVTEGHPDKMADQISDAILDAIITSDPFGRVACETFISNGLVFIGGEISCETYVDIPGIVRDTVREIGYTDPHYGFDSESCAVLTNINQQSPDIAIGVDRAGAGDQGMMFGYASSETEELMPMPITLAHKITMKLSEVRRKKVLTYLRPDGKSQVTVRYKNHKPEAVEKVVVSANHDDGIDLEKLKEDIIKEVIEPIIPENLQDKNIKYFINPTGRFVVGGPKADTGLTGRKVVVDTYGGSYYVGGGCFSGKDPTKVDRSASYFARYVTKNVVKAGLAERCGIQVAYAIGIAEPVSLMVETFGTGKLPDNHLTKIVQDIFDFTPGGIINHLELLRPIYKKTAAFGHFGRKDKDFTWESTDKVKELLKRA